MNLIEKLRKQKFLSVSLMLFTLSIGILIGTLINTGVVAKDQGAPGAKPLVIPSPAQMQNSFSTLAKQLEPSVVHISTTYEARPASRSQNRSRVRPRPDEDGEDMGDLFNRFFGFNDPSEVPRGRRGAGTGSGVIVDPTGYILTNNHVVDKAERIQVTLFNGGATKYDAKLIGTDADTDLAVIKIEAGKSLTTAKIGNSDSMQVGDWAIAIGSPFGLQATVTAGIISAKERDLGGREHQFQRFLQTDAAINPGNSGGPLINIAGEVIGINTAIASGTGGYQGIGFALPSNTAAKVYNSIIKTGKVTRGAIGIEFSEAQPELLSVYGAKEGVFVLKVTPGKPASKAGIQPEDVIVALNGQPVKNGQDLVGRISDMEVGSNVTVTVLRDKKQRDMKVTVGDRGEVVNASDRSGRLDDPERGEAVPAKFGLSLENITQARRESLNFPEDGGVLVAEVQPGSMADDIGIQANDVITAINRQPIKSVDDIRRIQAGLKAGDAVVFRLHRANGPLQRREGSPRLEWATYFLSGRIRD